MAKRPGKTRASDAWGTKSTPERTERVQFKVSTDEIAAIDEFQFQTRMPNRATAIRELLRRGLGAPKTERDDQFKARVQPALLPPTGQGLSRRSRQRSASSP